MNALYLNRRRAGTQFRNDGRLTLMPKLFGTFPAKEGVDSTLSTNSRNLLDILRHFIHHLNGF